MSLNWWAHFFLVASSFLFVHKNETVNPFPPEVEANRIKQLHEVIVKIKRDWVSDN